MDVIGPVASVLTLVAVGVGVVLWRSAEAAAGQAAKDQASEIVREVNRAAALARDLERTRGTERQELRFTSYGALWAQMRPLAIYDKSPINRQAMEDMSTKLSDWYFSVNGGLMLTRHNRDLYFALQDLVGGAADTDTEWEAERIAEPSEAFKAIVEGKGLKGARALLEHLGAAAPQTWPSDDVEAMAGAWREDVRTLVPGWTEIESGERFAVLQQVSSVLRTGLTYDVESRLR